MEWMEKRRRLQRAGSGREGARPVHHLGVPCARGLSQERGLGSSLNPSPSAKEAGAAQPPCPASLPLPDSRALPMATDLQEMEGMLWAGVPGQPGPVAEPPVWAAFPHSPGKNVLVPMVRGECAFSWGVCHHGR